MRLTLQVRIFLIIFYRLGRQVDLAKYVQNTEANDRLRTPMPTGLIALMSMWMRMWKQSDILELDIHVFLRDSVMQWKNAPIETEKIVGRYPTVSYP